MKTKEGDTMRITKYRTELNKDGLNVLVKDSGVNYDIDKLEKPDHIVDMLNVLYNLNHTAEEYLYLLTFNTKGRLLGLFEVSHGTVNYTIIGMREVFVRIFLVGATSFAVVHNHPSGDPDPSNEDHAFTNRFKEAAKIMGISFLDHIIISENNYYSFKECSQI